MRFKARLLVLLIWTFAEVWAAPPLTTIQDVLYKADGTTFTGSLYIEWKSFEATDSSYIATQSLTVPVVNGVLRVQLVPTTNAATAASYLVRYNSDGNIQYEETWAVPPSSVMRSARSSSLSRDRATNRTLAPASPSRNAVASPIP
jgi:hypothetical protein